MNMIRSTDADHDQDVDSGSAASSGNVPLRGVEPEARMP